MEAPRPAASSSKKSSSSLVPWAIGAAVVVGLIVLWERRSKAATTTGGTTGGQDITPINYVPPSNIDRIDDTQPTKKVYELMLVGDASDAGPLMLAKAWTGDATQARLAEIQEANGDTLKRIEVTPVVFVDDETGTAMPATIQRVALPAGQMVDAPVNAGTAEGNNYPYRPSGTTSGSWRPAGAREPSLTPWIVGQTIKIPEAWGAPPAALASRASPIQTSV